MTFSGRRRSMLHTAAGGGGGGAKPWPGASAAPWNLRLLQDTA